MELKCKICGGDLDIQDNHKVAVCQYCGTEQVLPKVQNEQKAKLYDRATHFRSNNEYDKAEALFEEILNIDDTDNEIYWQLVLCEYGVEYIKDKKTDKYIPTCNRTKTVSIFLNDNYKKAIKYEKEAKQIDEIQKKAIEIASKEKPFDIFICYKETDEEGKRTQDSVLAQDIYNNLTQDGYKVFFSKITLENKLGVDYEPYIFSALNSSKIMIVVGTKKENFESVWVKNEWSRFLALAKDHQDKTLIPTFKDMDPYLLPEEFAHLQALDLGKIGVITDIKNTINMALNKKDKNGVKKKSKTSENSKKNSIIIKILIIVMILAVISTIAILVTKNVIIPQNKYNKAENLITEEKYNEAIAILEEIKEYKDSQEKISNCEKKIREKKIEELAKYCGTYDKTEMKMDEIFEEEVMLGYILEIKNTSISKVEFSLFNYGRTREASISGNARIRGDVYEYSGQDSWGNYVNATLKFEEDGITVNLKITDYDYTANFDIGEGKQEFKFSDMIKEDE